MDDLLDTYSRMQLLEMARSDYDVDGLIGRADRLAGWVTGQKPALATDQFGGYPDPATLTNLPRMDKAEATNVVDFPLVDDAVEVEAEAATEPARKERKPRVAKVKAAKGKRGRPAKAAKAADTGDAPGDAPETAPVANGAMPHGDPQPEAEQSPMAA